MAEQDPNSCQEQEGEGEGEGVSMVHFLDVDDVIPYFASFDHFMESHKIMPSPTPTKYLPPVVSAFEHDQEDEAVFVQDQEVPVDMMAEHIEDCSESRVNRWRERKSQRVRQRQLEPEAEHDGEAELAERERNVARRLTEVAAAEVALKERELQQRSRARRQWMWAQFVGLLAIIWEYDTVFLFLGELIAFTLFMGAGLRAIWIFWRLVVLLRMPDFGIGNWVLQSYKVSVTVLWSYLIYCFGAYLFDIAIRK